MAKIVFLQLNQYELHGPQYIAAVLEAHGHEAALVVPGFEPDPVGRIVRYGPDVVGIGHSTVERKEAVLWASALKKHVDALIVLGGIDPTFYPGLALDPCVDAVIRGEAELSMLELMDRVDSGDDISDIPGLAISMDGELKINPCGPLIRDLDSLPFPKKDLYLGRYKQFRKFPIKGFLASRGCPHNCTYCANHGLRGLYPDPGHYVRFKSPEYLTSEIKSVLGKYPARTIGFRDDLFTHKHSWLEQFLPRYRDEIGIPFSCTARIDTMTHEKAALLAESGCYTCWYGLESANPDTREMILNRRMSNQAIKRGADILHSHGILTQSYNMMNIPGENIEDGLDTLRLNTEIGNDFVVASLFQPFPGTEILERLIKEGKIDNPDNLASRESLSYFAFSPFQQKDTDKFENLQKFFIIGNAYPRLAPIIKKLCSLPKNPLFDILFLASFAIYYGRSHRLRAWEVVYYNLRHVWTTYLAKSRFLPPEDNY